MTDIDTEADEIKYGRVQDKSSDQGGKVGGIDRLSGDQTRRRAIVVWPDQKESMMPETLRRSITDFCDNTEKWFSGKDILLFVKQVRDILEAHPPEEEAASSEAEAKEALRSLIQAVGKATSSLQEARIELNQANEQAKAVASHL